MKLKQVLFSLWALAIVVLCGLHLLHLEADFPNHSRWMMDWSKYTDEGWYGSAAIQHHLKGSWYLPGDFNTGAAVPVWPFLEGIVFHFSGVSLLAARVLAVSFFYANVLLCYLLVRKDEKKWVALLACSLIASSSFLFCFSRLAILEPLLICLTLASLLLARTAGEARGNAGKAAIGMIMGLLFCLMVLTKTTAVFLLPAILYTLWYPLRKDRGAFLRVAFIATATASALWSAYFFFLVRPRYLADYHYFFRINVYPKPGTLSGWLTTLYFSFHGLLWPDRMLAIWELILLAATLLFARSVWRKPLFLSSLLAIAGYLLFITYIDNMQPRYYAVTIFFMFLVSASSIAALLRQQRTAGVAMLAIAAFLIAHNAWQVSGFLLHPQYTFVTAARDLTKYVDDHPNGNRLLVSISGDDITLITGLPALCDDFGTMDLPAKLARYNPGWYAAWNELDPGTLEDLQTRFSLERTVAFRAFDDEDRDTLILYKLHPRN